MPIFTDGETEAQRSKLRDSETSLISHIQGVPMQVATKKSGPAGPTLEHPLHLFLMKS